MVELFGLIQFAFRSKHARELTKSRRHGGGLFTVAPLAAQLVAIELLELAQAGCGDVGAGEGRRVIATRSGVANRGNAGAGLRRRSGFQAKQLCSLASKSA